MSDEPTPSVEEIKERLKIEVEEEIAKEPAGDVVESLRDLGRQFAETVRTAWNSQERHNIEAEVREGVKTFADEINKAIHEVREGPAGQKVREEAQEVKKSVESGDLGRKTKAGIVQGLQWLSEELNKLANQFTPKE